MKQYPFNTFQDMWTYVSQLSVGFDIERLHSKLLLAKKDVEKIIGRDLYKKINDHFFSNNYNQEDEADEKYIRLNKLVPLLQGVVANFAVYRHYIWMVVDVSTAGVSQLSGDEKKPVTQSMSQEAKNDLIDSAWMFFDDLLIALDEEIDNLPEWAAIRNKRAALILFKTAADFNRVTGIETSSFFFELLYQIIEEIETENVKSRFNVEDITALDDKILYNLRKAVGYNTLSEAIMRFDYHLLPAPIRHDIDSEKSSRSRDKNAEYIKDKLKGYFSDKASGYYANATNIYDEITNEDSSSEEYQLPNSLENGNEEDPLMFVG